jgi:MFS family permease
MRAQLHDLVEPLQYSAFRRVWVSGLLSQLGDWASRLALSVMVFDRTDSAFAAAAALAVSVLPWLGPGQWVTALTERYPRRRVMVAADVVRALLFILATTGLPLPALFALLFVSGLATPPFEAARSSVLPELLPAPVFASSQALRGISDDATLIGGYMLGGAVLAVLSPEGALLANAAGFAVSAALLVGLPASPAPSTEPGGSTSRLVEAARLLLGTPHLRRAVVLVTVALAAADTLILLAVPRVIGELHRGPLVVSWLITLGCAVTIGATLLIPHRVDGGRLLTIGAGLLTVGGLGTALALVVDRGLVGLAAAFALSGLLAVVMVPANIVVSTGLPSHVRASALSILLGSLYAAQAAIPVLAGAAADAVGVIATCAAVMLLAGLYGAYAMARPVAAPAEPADATEPVDAGLSHPELTHSEPDCARSTVEVLA